MHDVFISTDAAGFPGEATAQSAGVCPTWWRNLKSAAASTLSGLRHAKFHELLANLASNVASNKWQPIVFGHGRMYDETIHIVRLNEEGGRFSERQSGKCMVIMRSFSCCFRETDGDRRFKQIRRRPSCIFQSLI